jgi:hypothetical protein
MKGGEFASEIEPHRCLELARQREALRADQSESAERLERIDRIQ